MKQYPSLFLLIMLFLQSCSTLSQNGSQIGLSSLPSPTSIPPVESKLAIQSSIASITPIPCSTLQPSRIPALPTPTVLDLETFDWGSLLPLSESLLVPSEINNVANSSIEWALEGGVTVYKRKFRLGDRCWFDCVETFWVTPFKQITIRMFRLSNRESSKAELITLYDEFGPAFFEYSDVFYGEGERSDAWVMISDDHEFVSARRYGAIVVIVSATGDGRTDDGGTEAMVVVELTIEQINKLKLLGFPE